MSLEPTTPVTTDTLTASAEAGDLDGDDFRLRYDWYGNEVRVVHDGGAHQSGFDRGDQVRVVVTPIGWDGLVGASSDSDAVTVINSLPVLGGVSLTLVAPNPNETLTCTAGPRSDADYDVMSLRYATLGVRTV